MHSDKVNELNGGAKKMSVVPKGTHIDFYDRLELVDPAVKDVDGFMREPL